MLVLANSMLVLNDQAACEAHFESDQLAVPALSRVVCSVSSQLPCDLRTNTATYICGSAQFPTGEPSAAQLRLRGGGVVVEVHWTLASDASKALALYWVPGNGPAQRFHILEPGCMLQQRTYASHRWRLIDEQLQQVVREYTATHEPIQVIAITYVQPADLPQQATHGHGAHVPSRLSLPAIDSMPGRGTLYAVAGGASAGMYLDWDAAQTAGAYSAGVPSNKFKWNERNTARDSEVHKVPADCWWAAVQYLASHLAGVQQAEAQRLLDERAAAAEAARRAEEERREVERRAAAERGAAQRREMEERSEAERLARERALAAASVRREAEHLANTLLADLMCEVASDATERAWIEAAERARAAAEQRDAASRAEAARGSVADALLMELLLEDLLPGVAAEAVDDAQAAQLAVARLAAAHAMAEEQERHVARAAAAAAASTRVAAAAVAAVVAKYPRRDQPDGARSSDAKKRRRAKYRAKQRQREPEDAADPTAEAQGAVSATEGETCSAAAYDAKLREAALRERALVQQLAASQARTQAERKRARRDEKTVVQRVRQQERSNGKAASRKRKEQKKKARAMAVRKDDERVQKRKVPTGEALHSGERKHRRLASGGSGGGGGGTSSHA